MSEFINTLEGYKAALHLLTNLIEAEPVPGSVKNLENEHLVAHEEDHEKRTVKLPSPTLVEAIRFRIEQAELMDSDAIEQWLRTPHPAFAQSTPLQIIECGDTDRIWRMIHQLETGEPA